MTEGGQELRVEGENISMQNGIISGGTVTINGKEIGKDSIDINTVFEEKEGRGR